MVQIAPAVRAAWGESLGLPPEKATVNRMAAVLRRLGFDYVFDTTFSADLTIMEEGTEFLRRFAAGETRELPMFTSCCPGLGALSQEPLPRSGPTASPPPRAPSRCSAQ